MHSQACATFFRHSVVLSLPAVLLRKVPINANTRQAADVTLYFVVVPVISCSFLCVFVFRSTLRLVNSFQFSARTSVAYGLSHEERFLSTYNMTKIWVYQTS